jgi:hypothetical protein
MASDFPGFISWDGEETRDAGYCLFGASINGARPESRNLIQRPEIRTGHMLDLLLTVAEANKKAPHIAYSFDYDVNNIIREFTWPQLITLRIKGHVKWGEYTIEHIPHKIFSVQGYGVSVRIDDIFSYFRSRYDKALDKYKAGTPDIRKAITAGKDNRSEFYYADIHDIRKYWSLELETMCELMTGIRKMAHSAGFTNVTQWHGPGALAAYSLKQNNAKKVMRKSPPQILNAALSAYSGGWFERFRFGFWNGPAYTADINSAYVYAMSLLPNLARGHWSYHRSGLDDLAKSCRFGVFHIEWQASENAYMRACHGAPFPLFHRDSDGTVKRPLSSDVWLWNPESANCSATPFAKLTEAWIFEPEDPDEYPFAWVADMFANRLALQAIGNSAEKILKWAMASYYGRLAQRTGWNEETKSPPQFHQIEFAGWITSWCRAAMYQVGLDIGMRGGLVSIDTDGLISTVPFSSLPRGIGNELGRWKVESFDRLIYIQNGLYWLHCQGCDDHDEPGWHDPKLRGIPRTKLEPEVAMEALRGDGKITLMRHSFRGYGAALQGKRDQWRTWVDDPVSVSALTAGSRVHAPDLCGACKAGRGFDETLHDLMLVPNRNRLSRPHTLPWMDGTDSDAQLAARLAKEAVTETR